MNNKTKTLATALLCTACFTVNAFAAAAADTDVSDAAGSANLTWAVIKPIMISIGVFTVAFAYFKRLRRA